jgi:hypothetical protein
VDRQINKESGLVNPESIVLYFDQEPWVYLEVANILVLVQFTPANAHSFGPDKLHVILETMAWV